MLIMQEVYYFSKGTYVTRKNLRVIYNVTPKGVHMVAVLQPNENLPQEVCGMLPSTEITPKQYKWYLNANKGVV